MKRLKRAFLPIILALIAIASLTFASCAKSAAPGDKPLVALSILPQRWFVARIAGDKADSVVLVGAGQDPHSWEPSPRQMELFTKADAWILSGADFERALVPRVRKQNPALTIIDGTEGVTFRTLENHDHGDESPPSADSRGDSSASPEIDRHSWLGREPAKILARHVAAALSALDPENAPFYEGNRDGAIAEIDAVFDGLDVDLAGLSGTRVFVYHPSFGYFLDEFGIIQEAVETGGKEPTAKHLAGLIAEARAEKPAAVFVQAQFPSAAAKTIADAVGARVIPLDPLAPDWLDNVKRMGQSLKELSR